MRVLIHLGLNKCASTYIQHALGHMQDQMLLSGIWYPGGQDGLGQYGLSRHYGFGPDVENLATQSVADMVASAKSKGCQRLILSSEYLSLHRPQAASRMIHDLQLCGCETRFLFFSRDLDSWIRSLFNQYVRTVEGGRYLRSIDDFVDQVLANRAIDVGSRYKMWANLVGADRLSHYRLDRQINETAVLQPFSEFGGIPFKAPQNVIRNSSVQPNALYRIGQLRSRFRNRAEEAELSRLLEGQPCLTPAPDGYLKIGPERRTRLQMEIGEAYDALPHLTLSGPKDHAPAAATTAA